MRDSEMKITVHYSAMVFKGRTSSFRWAHGPYKEHTQLVLTKWLIIVMRCDEKCQVLGMRVLFNALPLLLAELAGSRHLGQCKVTNGG